MDVFPNEDLLHPIKPIDECRILLKELLREIKVIKKDVECIKKTYYKDDVDKLLLGIEKVEPVSQGWFF